MDISFFLKKPDIIELFNFKNKECQEKFYWDCENSSELMNCLKDSNKSFKDESSQWFRTLKSKFYRYFKKIRCTSKRKETEISKLLEKRKNLVQKLKLVGDNSRKDVLDELVNVEQDISNRTCEENRQKVIGTTSTMGVWKIKKKVFPKCSESPPFAKKDFNGKLISTQLELKQLYLVTFTHRLRHRPIKDDYVHLKLLKEDLCRK